MPPLTHPFNVVESNATRSPKAGMVSRCLRTSALDTSFNFDAMRYLDRRRKKRLNVALWGIASGDSMPQAPAMKGFWWSVRIRAAVDGRPR